jgi:hypothetical protein
VLNKCLARDLEAFIGIRLGYKSFGASIFYCWALGLNFWINISNLAAANQFKIKIYKKKDDKEAAFVTITK